MSPDNAIVIRRAGRQDVDALIRFNSAMAQETEGKQLTQDVLQQGVLGLLADEAHGFYLIAEAEGRVVGCLMVTREWSDWRNGQFWWLQSVYVVPQWRRRGVYRQLYDHVRQCAQGDSRVCGLRLYVERDNAVAQSTYRVLGMDETAYRIYQELWQPKGPPRDAAP